MSIIPRRLRSAATVAAGSAMLAGMLLASPASALASSAGGAYPCSGGAIPGGTYQSIVVAGPCALAAGSVKVTGNLEVATGGALYAAFNGNDLSVGRNVTVDSNGVLVVGCDPEAFPCLDDPAGFASASVGSNLSAYGALAMVVHNVDVAGNVTVSGGGGGVNCDGQPALFGFPAYATFEHVTIGRNATITGWQSCWSGFFRNHVAGNMTYNDNITADPDGNEIQTNWIGRNLSCSGNSPAPQQGDSHGLPNIVLGKALGQCAGLTQ